MFGVVASLGNETCLSDNQASSALVTGSLPLLRGGQPSGGKREVRPSEQHNSCVLTLLPEECNWSGILCLSAARRGNAVMSVSAELAFLSKTTCNTAAVCHSCDIEQTASLAAALLLTAASSSKHRLLWLPFLANFRHELHLLYVVFTGGNCVLPTNHAALCHATQIYRSPHELRKFVYLVSNLKVTPTSAVLYVVFVFNSLSEFFISKMLK